MIGYNFEYLPERLGEARITLADISKALSLLNWEPTQQLKDWVLLQKVSGKTVTASEFLRKRKND